MRYHPFFALALVVLSCLAGGTLECGRPVQTIQERRGEALYAQMCSVCHGRTGEGYKADEAPTLRHPDFLSSVTDEFLRVAIADGRKGTTMSAWSQKRGGPLTDGDVQAVIGFLRTWEREPRAALDERPLRGDAARGAAAFQRDCARCHGARGTGGPNVSIGNRELLATASNGFLRHAIRGGRQGTEMPSFEVTLGASGIEDVVAHLRVLQIPPPPVAERPPAPAPVPPIPLGPVPLNPHGPEPRGFKPQPGTTPADVVHAELERHARMALLDARAPSDYSYEHIAGAVSVPFYDPEPYIAALPRDAWLVCYCACPHAESGQLAQKLGAKGFTKVTILDEGLGVWKSKTYGTHSGAEP